MAEILADPNRYDPLVKSKETILKAVSETAASGQPQKFVLNLQDYGRPLPIDEKLEEEIDDSIIHVLRPLKTIIESDEIGLEDGSLLQSRITTYQVLWDGRSVSIVKIQNLHKPFSSSRDARKLNTNYSTEAVTQGIRYGNSSGNTR